MKGNLSRTGVDTPNPTRLPEENRKGNLQQMGNHRHQQGRRANIQRSGSLHLASAQGEAGRRDEHPPLCHLPDIRACRKKSFQEMHFWETAAHGWRTLPDTRLSLCNFHSASPVHTLDDILSRMDLPRNIRDEMAENHQACGTHRLLDSAYLTALVVALILMGLVVAYIIYFIFYPDELTK